MPETNKPTVSVVIPAYNEELLMEATLATVFKQDYPGQFELIVCDNNSTDATAAIAAKMGARVVTESRKGTRFAYDAAMRAATGDLILMTNADVRLPPNWISRIVAEYQDPEVVGVGTKVKFYSAPDWINFALRFFDKINPKQAMWGPSLSCRRDIYQKVGGFNHGVNTNEDAIFTLLIEKLGKVKIIPDVFVEMDGRRFNNGFFSAVKQWFKSYGLNSVYIQFHYFLTGQVKTLIRDFGDLRSQTFGQGEKVQISVVIPVGNDQQYIARVLSDLEKQTFNLRFRVFVLNNESTDLTLQLARNFPGVTPVSYSGVYDLGSKLRLLLNSLESPVVAFTTARSHLPTDWLEQIYQSFNRKRKKSLQALSGPHTNEYSKLISYFANQTLDRMSARTDFGNLAILTSEAKLVFNIKGDQDALISRLEAASVARELNVSYSTDFHASYADEEVLASFLNTSATSVKHTIKKLFKL